MTKYLWLVFCWAVVGCADAIDLGKNLGTAGANSAPTNEEKDRETPTPECRPQGDLRPDATCSDLASLRMESLRPVGTPRAGENIEFSAVMRETEGRSFGGWPHYPAIRFQVELDGFEWSSETEDNCAFYAVLACSPMECGVGGKLPDHAATGTRVKVRAWPVLLGAECPEAPMEQDFEILAN